MVAFAVGAGTYVARQNLETNKDFIKEKLGSVKSELENKLKRSTALTPLESEYLAFLLKKFSGIFATDINIYNKNGDLWPHHNLKFIRKG